MNQGEKDSNRANKDRIKQEASDWLAKYDRGVTAEEQDAFFEWLGEDPRHGESYNPRHTIWKNLNVLAEWRPEHSLEPNPDLLAIPHSRPLLKWAGAISALTAVFLIGLLASNLWRQEISDGRILLAADDGALFYEYHVLEDGSVVELNRGAQVSVRYMEDQRLINLLAGEAHFTVLKDVNRPFLVEARGTVIRAVGTAFNVSLSSEKIEVLVTEGRVLVSPANAVTFQNPSEDLDSTVRELVAGQSSHLSLRSEAPVTVIEEVSNDDMARRLAWKSIVLEFTATPLSEVVLEFNRRNHTQLVIRDSQLGEKEVTATLRPNNLDGFIELLELTLNVQAERKDDAKIILSNGGGEESY